MIVEEKDGTEYYYLEAVFMQKVNVITCYQNTMAIFYQILVRQ